VVVAATQPEQAAAPSSPPTAAAQIAQTLEHVPPLDTDGRRAIDVPAVLARRPQVCLVDGLAYANPPGSRHATRHDDVAEILDAGISILTSINIEYIAEQQDFVESVLGVRRLETVPQDFINRADEIVIVDAPTDAGESAGAARQSQLRQRALLLAADVVDRQLEDYLRLHGVASSWGSQERILVCMTPFANAAKMLASGRRNADRFHGELFAIYVTQDNLTPEHHLAIQRNELLARAQQAHVEVRSGGDAIAVILEYARSQGITQIFVGHSLRRSWRHRLAGTPLDRLIRDADGIDVRVFPQ
jgi:two-component system sensor histidine kinase KdpD